MLALLAFIPVDDHVLSRATGSDEVEFAVAVEISGFDVFAGHRVVIEGVRGPSIVLPEVHANADLAFGVLVSPAGDDLLTRPRDELPADEGVALL